MSLIKKIHEAVQKGQLPETFTVENLKSWIKVMKIMKDDGKEYAAASIDAILSNSDIKNDPTSNLNTKILKSRLNNNGKNEYFF